MRVPAVIFGSAALLAGRAGKVLKQVRNVASLPRIVDMAYAMPDAH
jgi:tRNA-splicing ligase RtcB